MLPIHLTPYISGLPYRIGAIEGLLRQLKDRGACLGYAAKTLEHGWSSAEKTIAWT